MGVTGWWHMLNLLELVEGRCLNLFITLDFIRQQEEDRRAGGAATESWV